MHLNIYRAPIDNDGVVNWSERWISKWNDCFFRYFEFFCLKTEEIKEENSVIIKATGKWAPMSKYVGFDTEITYKIFNNRKILVNIHAIPYGKFSEVLPRLGVYFEMNEKFQNVVWYGRGEDKTMQTVKHIAISVFTKKM